MTDVVSDPAFPDRIGVAGGPMAPCRVTEFSITTAPTVREYYDGGVHVRDQTAQHVIRYELPAALSGLAGDPVALFGRVPVVVVGQELSAVHALVLDAHRRSRGLPPWLRREPGSPLTPRAAEVNEAVTWWNEWQDGGVA